jgi:hypothetical protein
MTYGHQSLVSIERTSALKGDLPVTRRLLRKSTLALILMLTAGMSKTFTQFIPPLPAPPSPDGTTGGDPVPINPGGPSLIALHLA